MLEGEGEDHAALWDWRRQVSALYGAVRTASPDGDVVAWAAWRAGRDDLFRSHRQSPVDQGGLTGLPFFPYDPGLRFAVRLREAAGAVRVVPAGRDGEMRLRPFATTDGLARALGRELTLFWVEGYGGGAFLPFCDVTTGATTFGGGRYLLDTIKGADLGTDAAGRTILDFNYAYNPSCSYSSRYICPLAPPENRLPVAVRGGEMSAAESVPARET